MEDEHVADMGVDEEVVPPPEAFLWGDMEGIQGESVSRKRCRRCGNGQQVEHQCPKQHCYKCGKMALEG